MEGTETITTDLGKVSETILKCVCVVWLILGWGWMDEVVSKWALMSICDAMFGIELGVQVGEGGGKWVQ